MKTKSRYRRLNCFLD